MGMGAAICPGRQLLLFSDEQCTGGQSLYGGVVRQQLSLERAALLRALSKAGRCCEALRFSQRWRPDEQPQLQLGMVRRKLWRLWWRLPAGAESVPILYQHQ